MNHRVRFDDPRRAERNLGKYNEFLIRSAPDIARDDLEAQFLDLLATCADPDMALTNFLRFLESSFTPSSLIRDFARYRVLHELLVTIFSTSQYFSDILVRDPELFRWLTVSDALKIEKTAERFRTEADQTTAVFEKAERKINALKRLYRREVLRIGVRDILGDADVVVATRELSALADAVIECTAQLAFSELDAQYGGSPATPWTIIALGKLGGGELNYSSDVDIMVVYGDEGEFIDAKGRNIQHVEFFIRMTEMIVRWMTVPTSEGTLYRIDLRLRPDGNAGPLARSVESMVLYYESRGEQWERQMLIKARPAAGDRDLGKRFLSRLGSFIYPRTFFKNPTDEIARLKMRIEEENGDEANIKLGPGGIRDIEFVVQALQLLNAGKHPELRTCNTMEALDALRKGEFISGAEWTTLRTAYIFFRNVEHRLQIMHDVQTHTLPSTEPELEKLARRLALTGGEELAEKLSAARRNVRGIFESVIGSRSSGGDAGSVPDRGIDGILLPPVFARIAEAEKNLHILLRGSSAGERSEFDSRTRDEFRHIAPQLMECIKTSINPDLALANLARLAARLKFPEQLYTTLRERAFCSLLVRVCSVSSRIVTHIIQHSIFLDILIAHLPEVLSGNRIDGVDSFTPYEYKYFQEVRTAIRDVLGLLTLEEMTRDLTATAEKIVRDLYRDVVAESGVDLPGLAVLALGKFGGREITYDSDLDLVFISSGETMERLESMRVISQTLVSRLTAVTDAGRLYDVDARLRPEGRNAPLVTPIEGYRKYIEQRAALWEIQSLVKARAVAGNPRVMREAESMVGTTLSSRRYGAEDFRSMVEMRRKTETRSKVRTTGFFDIKLGSGGMLDIEFISQAFCLLYLSEGGTLPGTGTLTGLEEAAGRNLIPREESDFLAKTYRLYRTIEKHMRLSLDTNSSVLPEAGRNADFLAKCAGLDDFDSLSREVQRRMKEVRGIFIRQMESFGKMVGGGVK